MTKLTDTPQFKLGMSVEKWLDDYFSSRGFIIAKTTSYQERVLCLGDRLFKTTKRSFYVEYKSGIQTFYTGNIFLETISVDSTQKLGWVYTSQANYIVYATLLNGVLLIFRPDHLRARMAELKMIFPERKTSRGQNDGYNTHGLIVPFSYARDNIANKVITIEFAGKFTK